VSGSAETEHGLMSPALRCALPSAPADSTALEAAGLQQPAPWMALTKGECLLLALALHRLSRANGARSGTQPEDLHP
jgi:hypothetical protein